MEFEGDFETHVTVRVVRPSDVVALRQWAARHHLPFHYIVLDRGSTTSQPMVARRGRGGLSGELAAASELVRSLAACGFVASRVKVEASPWNRDIPISDEEAAGQNPGLHFEHHVKLLLGSESDISALDNLSREHAAHLSRNALRTRDDGRREQFVTQRCYSIGRTAARRRLDALLDSLMTAGYTILDVEEEYVVHDSDPGVDSGWIDQAEAP